MNPEQQPWYREPWVWLLISFPLTAVIGGIITLYLAIRSNDGLVVDDYYRRGLEINRVLDRDRRATEQSLQARLQLGGEKEPFRIILTGNKSFEPPDSLQVSFLHATRGGYDRTMLINRQAENIYSGTMPELVRGTWHLQIETDEWRLLESFKFPSQ